MLERMARFPGKGPSASLLRLQITNPFPSPTGGLEFFPTPIQRKCKDSRVFFLPSGLQPFPSPALFPVAKRPPISTAVHHLSLLFSSHHASQTHNTQKQGVSLREVGSQLRTNYNCGLFGLRAKVQSCVSRLFAHLWDLDVHGYNCKNSTSLGQLNFISFIYHKCTLC